MTRIPIRYSLGKGLILRSVLCPARLAYVEIDDSSVRVRMSWAFSATFDRSNVESVYRAPPVLITAGVHGWRGRWLVNGASGPIVTIRLKRRARAWVIGFPVRLRELSLSIAATDELIAAVRPTQRGIS